MRYWAATLGALLAALTSSLAQPAGAVTLTANPELVARNYLGQNGAQATHPLTLSKLDIRVDIAGGVARTTVEATFQNPTGSALEADFALDLPPGSIVTGYALDVNGILVDGVLEGTRKATLAYQRRVRAGADPGLAVVTRDNAFRTHVFPIFPGRGRTIRMSFVTPVAPGVGLRLPLATLDPVGQVSVRITDKDGGRTTVAGPDGLALDWRQGSDGAQAQAQATNLVLAGALSVGAAPLLERPLIARHAGGDAFFEVAGTVDSAVAKPSGGKLRIYWDRSLSRRHDDLAAEADVVAGAIAAVKPDTVELVLFADDEPTVARFGGPGAAEGVSAALKAADYGGATSLRHVLTAAPGRADLCLFVSDGRVTLDAYEAQRAPCVLYAVSSGADADHGFLSALARMSGGEHVDLRAGPVEAAVARITSPGARVAQVSVDGADADFTLLPAGPGAFRVVGKALNAHQVVVTLADGQTRSFDVENAASVDHDGLGALWGADRIAEADATDRPDLDHSLALARRYSVAGDGAVFVVLETLDDYANAEITPPDSAGKDLQRQYARLVAERGADKARQQAARLDEVIAEWREERAWWANPRVEASADEPLAPREAANAGRPIAPVATPRPEPPPPPPPPSAPPQSQREAAADATSVQDLVVTAQKREQTRQTAPVAVTAFTSSRRDMVGVAGVNELNAFTPGQANADQPAGKPPAGGIEIAVEAWDPNRPYLKALKAAAPGEFWTVFKAQQASYGNQPAFYLDVGELLFRQGKAGEAQVMARSALETPTSDTTTMIIVADRMMRYGDEDRAIWLYEKVLYLDPDRPQPRRSLALALIERAERAEKRGEPASAHKVDYRRAMDLLNEVITRPWDTAFTGIELVALVEANHLQPRLDRLGVDSPLDRRLRSAIDVDLRMVLEWNVDATDMDLWVDEPTGERVIYNHPRSRLGGRLSHDMTQGYGPEEYLLRHAVAGDYTIRANIFASDRLNPNGPITIRAHLYRDYGRPGEKHEILDLEVHPGEDGARVVGEVKVGAAK